MKLAFTICSNNYLAQAKILGDSLLKHNPDYKMIIGLCDKKSDDIDYDFFEHIEIVAVEEINIPNFDEIIKKYDIVELNTSIKPSFFKYFIGKYKDLESIVYLDPDIQVFNKLDRLNTYLVANDILLTPHILKPISVDDMMPSESLFLNYGIYNLGFLALNPHCDNVLRFLNWWEQRTLTIGYDRVCDGLFVDQLWINFVPLFFDKVKILSDLGLNAAPWNLHERPMKLSSNSNFLMEDKTNLYLYHFSSYNYKLPQQFSKYYNRFKNIEEEDWLLNLYGQYHEKLLQNQVEVFSIVKCYYQKEVPIPIKVEKKKRKLKFSDFIPPVIPYLVKKMIGKSTCL
ncbi:glycosyltransferase [Flavobacterium faecale]|uniref:glycosyltransferase n=1 Tax=Flavobacterium faecale TaxID=1355330 RepID=UPI00131EE32A|nr:glycosyltransferase [Flavobacterium faecale]